MNDDKTSNSKNNYSLINFKQQVDIILKQLKNFNKDDENAAINYVKQHITKTQTVCKGKKTKKSTLKKHKRKVKGYNCELCGTTEKTKIQFLKHIEKHIGNPITCRKCRRTFNNETSFDWHINTLCRQVRKVLTKSYCCSQCPKQFTLKTHLVLHEAGHKRNNCPHCGLVFTKSTNLLRHLADKHNVKLERKTFKCNHCPKSFIRRCSLYTHLQKHSEFVCLDCGFISNNCINHNIHISTHVGEKPWQCSRCGDRFTHRQFYFNHLKRHDRYKCLTCKESFASQFHAFKHKKRGHCVQGLEPRLHCPYCPSTFFRSYLLQIHLHKHQDEDHTLHCKFCNKSFETPRQYFKHCLTTTHDKKTPNQEIFVCEHCGKQFMKKHIFDNHLLTYHGEKLGPYTCKHCEYKTKFKPNLRRHLKLHFTKENQFICDYCGKYFSNNAVLNDHINYIHKEQKQLKCDKCDKSFRRKSELTRHLSAHSDIRPYSCEVCPNTYKRISHLRRHEERAHAISKKSNKVKRFDTNESGGIVPVSLKLNNLPPSMPSTSSNANTDKLCLQILNKIDSNRVYLNFEKDPVTSLVEVQNELVEYTLIPSLNFGGELFSVVVDETQSSLSML